MTGSLPSKLIKNMLTKLKEFLKEQKIDLFLLPNSDEFFSEYLPEKDKRIECLTGFTGSNATVIFGQEKSFFFTDGRYILQAKNQLDLNEFEVFNLAETPLLSMILKDSKLAIDAKLSSVNFVKNLQKKFPNLVILNQWPLPQPKEIRHPEKACHQAKEACRPQAKEAFHQTKESCHPVFMTGSSADRQEAQSENPPQQSTQFFSLPNQVAGLDSKTKISQILQNLEADALLLTKPENICWLLNIRGRDLEFTPTVLTYAILFKTGKVELFTNKIPSLGKEIKKIQIDESATNHWLYSELQKSDFELINKLDPIDLVKSQKNSAEILGAIKAHEEDGLAVTKFLFWLQNCGETNEISAAKKLLEFRQESPNFFSESFAAISAFASNGAVIHYHSTPKTNVHFSPNQQAGSLYLIDSGGQYLGENFCGTTDITRTIAIGKPTAEMVENFTRVLKGHIALARARFLRGTSGAQLDVLAREHLWRAGLNYDHGTGHGVGSFLSVHEGPCGISKRAHQELLSGMILSNEPGFYKEGEYGIRIENLMLVEEFDQNFLQFKTLTLAPLDPALINFKMLTYPEKKWLSNYHQEIYEKFAKKLSQENEIWLKEICEKF